MRQEELQLKEILSIILSGNIDIRKNGIMEWWKNGKSEEVEFERSKSRRVEIKEL
ncbi:hypothetical protein ES708_32187 [subsurface metagenome]